MAWAYLLPMEIVRVSIVLTGTVNKIKRSSADAALQFLVDYLQEIMPLDGDFRAQ